MIDDERDPRLDIIYTYVVCFLAVVLVIAALFFGMVAFRLGVL